MSCRPYRHSILLWYRFVSQKRFCAKAALPRGRDPRRRSVCHRLSHLLLLLLKRQVRKSHDRGTQYVIRGIRGNIVSSHALCSTLSQHRQILTPYTLRTYCIIYIYEYSSGWNLNIYGLINNRRGSHCGPMRLYNVLTTSKGRFGLDTRSAWLYKVDRWRLDAEGLRCDMSRGRVEAPVVGGESLKMIELWPFNETKVLYPSSPVVWYIPPIIYLHPSRRGGWDDVILYQWIYRDI